MPHPIPAITPSAISRTVGVVGVHGFAQVHLQHLLRLRAAGVFDHLVAVAHAPERDPAWIEDLRRQDVNLVPDIEGMLAVSRPDLVTLPVGISLHVPMSERLLAHGIPVYLEKPVAGSLDLFDRLARYPLADRVQVGFQHLALPGVRALRSRLSAGEFGRLRRIVVTCGWPRGDVYYQRNAWAGRLRHQGEVINDSPANNANAHHLNLALFLAGRPVVGVEANLGRGNPIESFDTCGVRVDLADGSEVVFNASHLGIARLGIRIRIECERTTITCDDLDAQPWWLTGEGEALAVGGDADATAYQAAIRHVVAGDPPVCTLAEARPHAEVVAAIHRHDIRPIAGCLRTTQRWCHPQVDAALLAAHAAGRPLRLQDLEEGRSTPAVDQRRSA